MRVHKVNLPEGSAVLEYVDHEVPHAVQVLLLYARHLHKEMAISVKIVFDARIPG